MRQPILGYMLFVRLVLRDANFQPEITYAEDALVSAFYIAGLQSQDEESRTMVCNISYMH